MSNYNNNREDWIHVKAYKHGQADALKRLLEHFGSKFDRELTQYINVEIEVREEEAEQAEKALKKL